MAGMGSRAAAIVALFVPAVAILVSWLAWRDRLPDVIASHWSGAGRPDGFLPATTMLAVCGGMALLGAIVGTASRARRTLFGTGAIAALGAGAWLVSAGLTIRAGSAQAAELGAWWLLVVLACAAYGALPYLLAGRRRELG